MTFAMPAEWERHERTIMGWPCRASSWGHTMAAGRAEAAAVANAIAEFEPVTMICANDTHAADARAKLTENVDVVTHPIDGSWLRDNAPIFVTNGSELRARHFRFNSWGERNLERDRDARLGLSIAADLDVPIDSIDMVLEGGAISVDGAGRLVAPLGCVMSETRNWFLTQKQAEETLKDALGVNQIIWLPQGLAEDNIRDPERMYYGTDGHADLFFAFIGPGKALMLDVPDSDPNHEHLAVSRDVLETAGVEVVDFPFTSGFYDGSNWIVAPYMNFYFCNGGIVMPVAGEEPDKDKEASDFLRDLFPDRRVVTVQMRAGPRQGGAVHCMTQQVPAV